MTDIEVAMREQPDFVELRFKESEQFDIRPAIKALDGQGIPFLFHLPRDPDWQMSDVRTFLPYIDLARQFGARLVTFHAPLSTLFYSDEEIAKFLRLMEPLVRAADDAGVVLSVENLGSYYTELTLLFDTSPHLRLTLDLGHGQLLTHENRAYGHIDAFFERIAMVNVHDNNGMELVDEVAEKRRTGLLSNEELRRLTRQHDAHLPIGQGRIDFRPLLHALKVKGYDGMFLMLAKDQRLFPSERAKFLRLWNEC